jgi:hypothetical protein
MARKRKGMQLARISHHVVGWWCFRADAGVVSGLVPFSRADRLITRSARPVFGVSITAARSLEARLDGREVIRRVGMSIQRAGPARTRRRLRYTAANIAW